MALLWKEEIKVDVQTSSDNHIDVVVDKGMDDTWQITGFYGNPDFVSREDSWSLIRDLSRCFSLPWVCIGDFNEILRAEEKQGWLDRPERQIQGFRDALDFCSLRDIGYNGFPFTWCNRRPGDHNIWVRLDRGVASVDWLLKFPTTRVHHLEAFHLDHRPLLLASDFESRRFYRKDRPFRFEVMWLKDKSCEAVIKISWEIPLGSSPVANFSKKIDMCQINLRVWNRNTFGHVRITLDKKLRELHRAEEMGLYSIDPDGIGQLRDEIQALKAKEEVMWKQRSRDSWLRDGDNNTKYFHSRATQRNKHNYISGLEDDNGVWVEEDSRMGNLFVNYFSTLFTTSNPTSIDAILEGITPKVTEEMNLSLTRNFTAEEIHSTMQQIAPLSASGPDGMSPVFYKSFWHIVGEDVTKVVLAILSEGTIPESINSTFISLIPKVKNPKKVSEFRLISLCNIFYKIIAKVLVNRLKSVLPHMVSKSQSAFLSGKLIADNVLVAFETLHYLKRKIRLHGS